MEIDEGDTEVVRETVEKDIQTEVEQKCSCEVDCEQSDVLIKEDKIIRVLKRAKCSEAEWKEYEEKVESEMDFKDLLEDLGKVIEAASRLSERNKEQVENNIIEMVVEPNTVKESMESEVETESGSPHIQNKNKETESCEEAVKESWIYCKICEYKCKKKNTIKKHIRTKHSKCISCDECGKLFASEYSLDIHKEKDQKEIDNESDQSFVFSKSMLDEFF